MEEQIKRRAEEKARRKGRAPRGARSVSVLGMNKLEALHQRYGHLGVANIKRALRQNAIVGAGVSYKDIKNMEMRVCPDCMKGRMKALPVDSSTTDHSNLGLFEVLATDDKGPFSVRTIHHYIRFDLFSWRSSHWLEVRFKKAKTEFFQHLQAVIMHKIARDYKVLKLQTDSDETMYNTEEVRQFLAEHGIEHNMSSPYLHAQNGWIERDMQSIMDIARTIMIPYNCPLRF